MFNEIIGNTRVALGEYKLDRDLVAFGEYGVCRGRLLSLPWKHITHGLAWGPQLACDIIDLSTSFIIIQHLSMLVAGTWMCSHLATREGCGLYWQIAKFGLR